MLGKLVSLYTGAGGLDLGFEASGFEISLAIESDTDCARTLTRNRQAWKIANPSNIFELSSRSALKQAGLRKREAALVIGGPPCQPFSKARLWVNGDTPRLEDERARTLHHFFRLVGDALPQAILLENVGGIAHKDRDEGVRLALSELDRINKSNRTQYRPILFSLNAANYGVPQRRERIFLVAERSGKAYVPPDITHAGPNHSDVTSGKLKPFATTWDAIGDLDRGLFDADLQVTGRWASMLPSIPEGGNYLWHTYRGGGLPIFKWRSRYWSFLLKLDKRQPSWTLQASPGPATGPFHWRNRKLSVREMCRLQSFPDEYEIVGNYRSATRQLGNAVPPGLAEVLASSIAQQLFGQRKLHARRFETTPNGSPPRRHPRRAVHKSFIAMPKIYEDHPGTGLGPRARSQNRKSTKKGSG